MNVIFLDIDGVLNSMAYFESINSIKSNNEENSSKYDDISEYHLKLLAEIYHKCNAVIVLCSSWRTLDNKNEGYYSMYQYLIDSLEKYNMKIYSKTPIVDMNRPLEIAIWLDDNNEKDINYVILDDDFSKEQYDEYELGDRLIRTKYFCHELSEGGLQPKHVTAAIKLLRKEGK